MITGLRDKKHSTPTITAGVGSRWSLVTLQPIIVFAPLIGVRRYEKALACFVVIAIVIKTLRTAVSVAHKRIVVYLVTAVPTVVFSVGLSAVVRAVVVNIKNV